MVRAYLELVRPANVVTSLADVLAGFAVAGLGNPPALPWLLASTACLYAGGVVLNDVFDRDLDRIERPERPIPSGRVTPRRAGAVGAALLLAGAVAAVQATRTAGIVATAIAAAVLLYDGWAKRHRVVAPLNMGLCRALNLLLGIAAVPAALSISWAVALIPLIYVSAVTALSQGEVHGGGRAPATFALVSLTVAWVALVGIALRSSTHAPAAGVLAVVTGVRVIPPFWQARQTPSPALIRRAVTRGVLSLVLVDATIGAAYAGPVYSALILLTGVLAGSLARLFAVT